MSKTEVKDEARQQEGDPQIKARIRSIQRELSRRQMMSAVPRATVVITNPTHLAIALAYDRGTMPAPQVVARGAGYLPERIKHLAKESSVPIVEDTPVAQMLYRHVEVGEFIPATLYFAVLIIINFVVITKGAGRIAEVTARFTLDAMPGKQMSIDAEMNAGLIHETEARQRRKAVEAEAEFYGAMDGASKFVRGDAVAGILITAINITGGFIIGVLRQGMSVRAAAQTYTLHPRAMGLASPILLGFAVVSGLPTVPFLVLAGLAGAVAYATSKTKEDPSAFEKGAPVAPETPETFEFLLPLDVVGLQVGYGLIPLVDAGQDGELLERVKSVRRQFAQEMGLVVPPLHIRDNLQLKPVEYAILLKGVEIARAELMPGHYLAMNPGIVEGNLPGLPTREPAFGLPATWIVERDRETAQITGYTVVNLSTVIATHLTELLKTHAAELLHRQAVQGLLDTLAQQKPKVVEELVPGLLSVGGVQKVLQNLLLERVSIRDLRTILEALADCAPLSKGPELLTEYARQRLARSICKAFQNDQGILDVMVLEPGIETVLIDAAKRRDLRGPVVLDPKTAQRLLERLAAALEKVLSSGGKPCCSAHPRFAHR